jgi:ribose/xylose/arabinose/galactoside ABC-type transport system permease subunit
MLKRYGIFISLLLIILILSFASEYFFTVSNFMNILIQSANIGIMAVGMTFVLIAGQVDLSVASVQALGACSAAVLMVKYNFGILPAIMLALTVGLMAVGVSGFFTGRFLIPAFITTLAMDSLAKVTAYARLRNVPNVEHRESRIQPKNNFKTKDKDVLDN